MSGADLLRRHLAELIERVGVEGEIVDAEGRLYVLLKKVELPAGMFRVAESDVLYLTDHQYPLSAMDMFWVEPALVRHDGSVPQGAESIETYIGRQWRR